MLVRIQLGALDFIPLLWYNVNMNNTDDSVVTSLVTEEKESFWDHTVLELYPKPLSGDLPTEGTPAEWIANDQVFYAQGHDELVIFYAPLRWILWIKLKKYVDWIYSLFLNNIYYPYTPWGKRQMEETDKIFDSGIEIIEEEELRKLFDDDEEYEDFLEVMG